MTSLVRTVALTVAVSAVATSAANAQRGRMGGGSLPRMTTGQPVPRPVMPAPPGRGGIMTVPRATPGYPRARGGGLPYIYTETPRGRSSYGGRGFGQPRRSSGRSRLWQPPYSRWGVGAGCTFGCVRAGAVVHGGRFKSSFFLGHQFFGFPFAFPIFVPYAYDATYDEYAGPPADVAYAEPSRAATKVIVVGAGTGGGGDALTVETIADSVRLTWLGSSRPAREVRLFVTDSTQRQLASRSASPAAPVATFEVATLSAPVAFAGVTVVFADGVTSTTVVPYRDGAVSGQRR